MWTNDDRGKPCQWQEHVDIDPDSLESGQLSEDQDTLMKAMMGRGRAALGQFMAANPFSAISVPLELLWVSRFQVSRDEFCTRYICRARVRWMDEGSRKVRDRNLREINAEFDAHAKEHGLTVEAIDKGVV